MHLISTISKTQVTTSTFPTPVNGRSSLFPESQLTNDVRYGYNRALMAWYNIDPLFTRRSSSLTPAHIKSDLNQLSDPYIRVVY